MKSRRRSTSCQDKCNATPSWQSLLNRFGLIVLVSHYFFILIFCYITLRPEEMHEKFTQEICRYTWLTRKCQLPKHHTQSVQGSVIIRDGQKALIRSPRMPPKLEAFLHAGKKKKNWLLSNSDFQCWHIQPMVFPQILPDVVDIHTTSKKINALKSFPCHFSSSCE